MARAENTEGEKRKLLQIKIAFELRLFENGFSLFKSARCENQQKPMREKKTHW